MRIAGHLCSTHFVGVAIEQESELISKTMTSGAAIRQLSRYLSPKGPLRLCVRPLSVGAASLTSSPPAKPWSLGRLNHVAIAVPDLQAATSFYRDILGATVSEAVPLPEHGVYTVFVQLDNTKLELLHPLGEKSPIEGFLAKKPGGGMHHICLEVDDINKAIQSLKGKIRTLTPEPMIGAHGKPVVFLHPKDCDGVLVELEEA